MSRVCEGDIDDTASFLRACAVAAVTERHLKGRKGQKLLRELEAALVALEPKELILGYLAKKEGVCALGALAVYRDGREKAEADSLELFGPDGDMNLSPWEQVQLTAKHLGLLDVFSHAVTFQNDDYCQRWAAGTDRPAENVFNRQRYTHVLNWVRSRIKPEKVTP